MTTTVSSAVRAELAPRGTLHVGLNLSNFLLVNKGSDTGEPTGIAPDIGRELARRLDLPLQYVKYPSPGDLAAAAASGAWDVGLIGADPLRAAEIVFTPAYVEIEATYLVPADSPIRSIAEVDRPGVRIAVADKAAYDMYLRRTLEHATLHRAAGLDASYQLFLNDKLDALAGLKPRLLLDQQKLPGSRVLEGRFTAIQQAIGTPIDRKAAAAYLHDFVREIIQNGFVANLIARHEVQGVTVAPAAR